MKDVNILFGMNAGKIWRALDSNKSLTKIQLMNETKLNENEFYRAIGWLAKEDKIRKEGDFYFLGQTNLSNEIENNVLKIQNIFENGKIDIENLGNITRMNQKNYDLALGWLARDGKLEEDIFNNPSKSISFEIENNNLKNEIESLKTDLEDRDVIIKQLTDKFTSNQFHIIEEKEKHNLLKNEVGNKNNIILKQKKELKSKKIEIKDLKNELDDLNSDIETRNILIKQIKDQLTDNQTQSIENVNMIKKLEFELNQNKNLIKMANEKFNERMKILSDLNNNSNDNMDINISKSTLFNKQDSLFSKKEKNDINNDDTEDMKENLISKFDKIEKTTLKNKKTEI